MDGQEVFDYQFEVEQLKEQFSFDFVGLALVQSAELRFESRWVHATGNRSDRYERIVLQTGKGVAGTVLKTGKPMLIGNVERDLGKTELYKYPIVVAEGLKSFGAIPLFKYNRVQGVLLVAYRDAEKLTTEEFARFKQVIGATFGPLYSEEKVSP